MSESTDVIYRRCEAEPEVELSAQDLLAMSDPRVVVVGQPETSLSSPRPSADTNVRGGEIDAKNVSSFVKAVRLPLSLFVVTVGIVGAAYALTTSNDTKQATVDTLEPAPQSPWPPPEQKLEGEPVLFANPFDAEEVFEFPPGTSASEAREAVAELLMKRAMSRQRKPHKDTHLGSRPITT